MHVRLFTIFLLVGHATTQKKQKMQKGSSLGSFFVTLPWPGSFLYRWQANRKIAPPWVRCLPFGVKLPCVQVRDLTLHDVTGNLNSGMQSIFSEPVFFLHQHRGCEADRTMVTCQTMSELQPKFTVMESCLRVLKFELFND